MMADRVARLSLIALSQLERLVAPSAPVRFHTLESTVTPNGAAGARAVMVAPVSVPASVDRPEFVVQMAPNNK